MIIDGKLYYGKSGFAGEFGHTPFFDNEIICSCGKKGCLETEVSGNALERKMQEKIDSGVNSILADKYNKNQKIFYKKSIVLYNLLSNKQRQHKKQIGI